jgi:hypothetical protein
VDDDADLDLFCVDAASLADRSHVDEGDRLTFEQHQPGAQPVLAPDREQRIESSSSTGRSRSRAVRSASVTPRF